jgi:hypothetical protein
MANDPSGSAVARSGRRLRGKAVTNARRYAGRLPRNLFGICEAPTGSCREQNPTDPEGGAPMIMIDTNAIIFVGGALRRCAVGADTTA